MILIGKKVNHFHPIQRCNIGLGITVGVIIELDYPRTQAL